MKAEQFSVVDDATKTLTGGQKFLGRYKLVKVLGQGGMGIVWLARDEELARDVALKFLPNILVNDRASMEDLKRETRRSLDLTHPNIVRTYDFVQDGAIAGISMEYVDSDTLRSKRIDQPNGVFEPAAMGDWVRQLCAALDYAHQQAGIVHRDLKPANLMVNGRGQLKVADFGISRSLTESTTQLTGQGGSSGTLVYMSPQQLLGEEPTVSDDVYAVGATLYELLTTRPPFYTGDIAGQIARKPALSLRERRIALGVGGGELPQPWEDTIAACLAKDPSRRPRSAGEIAVGLGLVDAASITIPAVAPTLAKPGIVRAEVASGERLSSPSTAATAPLTTPSHSPSKFPQAMLLVILLALLTGGGFAAWHFVNISPPPTGTRPAPKLETVAEPESTSEAKTSEAKPIPPPVPEILGSIFVKTTPADSPVRVKIDDGPVQENLELFPNLKLGKHTVEVSREDYDTDTQVVEAKEGTPITYQIDLNRSKGGLTIKSQPESVAIKVKKVKSDVNFNAVASETTWTRNDLPTGEYEITLYREDWAKLPNPGIITKNLIVTKGQPTEETFDLSGGSVKITSTPAGAKVMQGEKEVAGFDDMGKPTRVTPLTIKDIPPGEVEYMLEKTEKTKHLVAGPIKFVASNGQESTLPDYPLKPKVDSSDGTKGSTRSQANRSQPRKKASSDNDDAPAKPTHRNFWSDPRTIWAYRADRAFRVRSKRA